MNNKINDHKTAVSTNSVKFLEVGGNKDEILENVYSALYNTSYVNYKKYMNTYFVHSLGRNNQNIKVIFNVDDLPDEIMVYLGGKKPKKVLIFNSDRNYNGKEVEIGDLLVFSDYTDTGYVVSQKENRKIHKRILESIFGFEIEEI